MEISTNKRLIIMRGNHKPISFIFSCQEERTREKETNYSECQTICEKDEGEREREEGRERERENPILQTKPYRRRKINYYRKLAPQSLGGRSKVQNIQ
jgi:hypothetical protein